MDEDQAPIGLPPPPNDPQVQLPNAPQSPPVMDDVIGAIRYREEVDRSRSMFLYLLLSHLLD